MTHNARYPLLMTRPQAASEAYLAQLPGSVVDRIVPVVSPMIEIAPLGVTVELAPGEEVIFTSANGVALSPPGAGRAAYCVGPATTQAAVDRGWNAQQIADTSADLVARLVDTAPSAPLVHLTGVHRRGHVAERLAAAGLKIRFVALYDQALPPLSDAARTCLNGTQKVIIPLFSPRTAKRFVAIEPENTALHVVALSPDIAAVLNPIVLASVSIAPTPNAAGMNEAIEKRLDILDSG